MKTVKEVIDEKSAIYEKGRKKFTVTDVVETILPYVQKDGSVKISVDELMELSMQLYGAGFFRGYKNHEYSMKRN